MRARGRRPVGFTLIEVMFFGALAAVVLVGAIGLLSRGSHFLEIGRRSSGSQSDLRSVLELMSDDAGELIALEDTAVFDAIATSDKSFKFDVRSTRNEVGVNTPTAPSVRRVEYKLGRQVTKRTYELSRTVTILPNGVAPPGGTATAGETATHVISRGISKFKIWPIAAVAQPGGNYNLVAASDPAAGQPGGTVACLIVDCTVGEADGLSSTDQSSVTSVVTKLWCRNRVMEISRGGLQ